MGIEAQNLGCMVGIQRQIQAGANTNLQNPTLGERHRALSIWRELAVPHCKIDQMRDNAILIESHAEGMIPRASI